MRDNASAGSGAGRARSIVGRARIIAGRARVIAGRARFIAGHARGIAGCARSIAGRARSIAGRARVIAGHTRPTAGCAGFVRLAGLLGWRSAKLKGARCLPQCVNRRKERGFSLVEVLVSLALGSLVLGVVMADVSHEVVFLSQMEPKYRAMIVAEAVLEKALAEHVTSAQSGTYNNVEYNIESAPVQADSRVLELKATVASSDGHPVSLSAYRLRALSSSNNATTE